MVNQLPKAYLRIDPNLDHTHPEPGLFVELLCAANRQPTRGTFKDRRVLEACLGRRRAARLLERGDLVEQKDGRLQVDGWDIWQEGDLTVGERMRRYRNKQRNGGVTEPYLDRIPPSETSRRQGVRALDVRAGDVQGTDSKPELLAASVRQPPPQPEPHLEIDYDPDDPLQKRLYDRCQDLALKADEDDPREILRAVSVTPGGKTLDSIRGAPRAWLEQTLRACDDFEVDL